MSLSTFITKRYIRSKKESKFISTISAISILGIAIGVMVLIISLTVLDGFESTVKSKIIQFNSHIKITAFGKRNITYDKSFTDLLTEKMSADLESISPVVSKDAIIKSKRISEGIILNGIDFESDNSELKNIMISGKYQNGDSSGLSALILGKKLAEKLFVGIGDKITIFTLRNDAPPTYDNPPAIEQYYVKGIYESGMAEYDDLNAYISLINAQKLFGIGNKVSGYNIKLNKLDNIESLKKDLKEVLGYPYYVRTYDEINKHIFTWLELQKKPIPLVLGLIILVAVFNIIGTLLMMVLERTSAIGILKSLGANRKQILKIFLLKGLFIALTGILIGNLLALVISIIQLKFHILSLPGTIYFISSVPISINPGNYLIVSGVALLLSLSVSLIPSYIASRIEPLSAIRFE